MSSYLKEFSKSLMSLDSNKLNSLKSVLYTSMDYLKLLENKGFNSLELKKLTLTQIMLIDQKLLELLKVNDV